MISCTSKLNIIIASRRNNFSHKYLLRRVRPTTRAQLQTFTRYLVPLSSTSISYEVMSAKLRAVNPKPRYVSSPALLLQLKRCGQPLFSKLKKDCKAEGYRATCQAVHN